MRKLLLVAPKFDSEYALAFRSTGLKTRKYFVGSPMAPLGLTTVAALTPPDWEVEIWDECARGEITPSVDLKKEYALVACTAYMSHLPRCIEIAGMCRQQGVPVSIGGPGVSAIPEMCRGEFDILFLGEGELIWQRFLKEFRSGYYRSEYRQVDRPDLAKTPVPRWELIADDLPHYQMVGVQTTRGCPFDCDFCDVIHLFGRKPRHKPIDTVLMEFALLQKLGGRRVFICDDDFIGDYKYAQELLKELVGLNRSFGEPLSFTTQCTIDLAKHDQIMKLMADANFNSVFIGIETPRKASLKEVNKLQNLQRDLAEDVHKIQSYGLILKTGLIVGFDSDDTAVFKEHIEFAEKACLTEVTVRTLKGMRGTPQWNHFQREGRILDTKDIALESPRAVTNVVPKGMTLEELMDGYTWLVRRIRDWNSFRRRVIGALKNIKYVPEHLDPARFRIPTRTRGAKWRRNLPWEARLAILQILLYTKFRKPHMMQHVIAIIGEQLLERTMIEYQRGVIEKFVRMYKSGELQPDVDESVGLIPANFERTVANVMPVIYDRLVAEMEYKPAIPEAYVNIFQDFLIRWGKGFENFDDFHMVYLNELCDRHIARWNQKFEEGRGMLADNVLGITREQSAHFTFVRAVLVAVEQELRGEARSHTKSDLALVQIATGAA